jgi:hypothetical protein
MESKGLLARIARRALSCLIPTAILAVTANAGNATGTVNMVEVSSIGGVFLSLISPLRSITSPPAQVRVWPIYQVQILSIPRFWQRCSRPRQTGQ